MTEEELLQELRQAYEQQNTVSNADGVVTNPQQPQQLRNDEA